MVCTAQKMKFSTAELVTFTEKILNGKLQSFFCCVKVVNRSRKEFCKEYTLLTMC